MPELEGFPYTEAEFAADGGLLSDSVAEVAAGGRPPTDLIVLVHGWNNTPSIARELYKSFARSLRAVARPAGDRTVGLYGVLWPSAKWDWFERLTGSLTALDTGPGTELGIRLDGLREVFVTEEARQRLAQARELLPGLERSRQAQREFVTVVRGLLPGSATADEDAPDELFALSSEALVERLSRRLVPPPGKDDVAVPADSLLWNIAGGFLEGARRLIDFIGYYEMKERAGTVGTGLARFLRTRVPAGVRVHLVGHSFGARLVSAAAATEAGGIGRRPCSVTLLQGAFSHHGFARAYRDGRDGRFRSAVTSGVVTGPMLISHTRNDLLVSIAYGVASQLAGHEGEDAFGPANPYGGIGANGAQSTPEAIQARLLPAGRPYDLTPGRPHNLLADDFIPDHVTVAGREVAHAILSAVAATP
ncbi:hypothetical protein ABGB18_01840 [Nonomuraea sp. B12E4]|uniref:hypothetical protein n=1 Tax=Nonomuraea sp. B12E4 TaxID=3153564 RepID=UPI00325E3A4E